MTLSCSRWFSWSRHYSSSRLSSLFVLSFIFSLVLFSLDVSRHVKALPRAHLRERRARGGLRAARGRAATSETSRHNSVSSSSSRDGRDVWCRRRALRRAGFGLARRSRRRHWSSCDAIVSGDARSRGVRGIRRERRHSSPSRHHHPPPKRARATARCHHSAVILTPSRRLVVWMM